MTIWWRVIQEELRQKHTAGWALTKTDTAINRIKTVGTCKVRIKKTYCRKQNNNQWGLQNCGHYFKNLLSPHIPYKLLEYAR